MPSATLACTPNQSGTDVNCTCTPTQSSIPKPHVNRNVTKTHRRENAAASARTSIPNRRPPSPYLPENLNSTYYDTGKASVRAGRDKRRSQAAPSLNCMCVFRGKPLNRAVKMAPHQEPRQHDSVGSNQPFTTLRNLFGGNLLENSVR